MIVAILIVAEVVKITLGNLSSAHRSQNIYMDYVSTVVEKEQVTLLQIERNFIILLRKTL